MDRYKKDINKFDGQYLKCIVSNYTSSKNLLANSGSLIVIQPKYGKLNDLDLEEAYANGTIHRNYVYLGDEFLASGFGFPTEKILNKAERIVKSYDEDITALKNRDIELNNKIDTEVERLYNELNNYVKIHGGHIEDTIVTLNGYNIPTRDIILYGEEAKYTNMQVKNVEVFINENETRDNVVFMPIGSKLKNITVNLELAKNDSGGIKDLQVLHKFDDDEYEGTKVLYDLDTDIILDEDYAIYKVIYSKVINDGIVIDEYKRNVLKRFYINVKGTPISAYKYYPLLYKKYNAKIISSGNAITDNVIDVGKTISIRPQYYVKYSENGLLIDNQNPNNDLFTQHIPLNSFNNYDETNIRFEVNNLMNNNGKICVAVPSNFSVNKIYMVRNNEELYNWTGAVSIIRNRQMTCVDTDPNDKYYIDYDIYCITAKNGFYENESYDSYQLEMNIIYKYVKMVNPRTNDIDFDYDENKPTNIPDTNKLSLSINNVDTLNDEEFNNLYWINYKNTYMELTNNVSVFKNRLENTTINGAVKNQI